MISDNSKNLEFHLYTKNTSYIIKVLNTKHLVNLYYGKRIRHKEDFSTLYQNFSVALGSSTSYSQETGNFSLDTTKLEVATSGKGDYREPSLHIIFDDQSRVSDFKYVSHQIIDEKARLKSLPHTFSNENKCKTLEIKLYDEVKDVYLILYYSVFYECDVITRSMKIVNGNKGTIVLEKAMSLNLDFSNSDFELLTLEGKWIRERHINIRKLNKGVYYIDSKKGVSSANHNPFMGLMRPNTDEHIGECYGFGLIYSGNHQGLIEVNPHNLTRIQMGINPFDFNWTLEANQEFETPEVIMTYSDAGLNRMSQNFHELINTHLISPYWQKKPRPVLINNWEATYFDFNEAKLLKLAKSAKNLGIELFVLDDGWFGKRDNDTTSLGDFFEDTKKLPNGLDGISRKINELGLDFGLWVEPESISIESELYKKHPEWAIQLPDREPSLGRFQLQLDLANPEVIDYLFDSLRSVFKKANVKYVKWDMNRNISDVYSNYLPKEKQMEYHHRYVLGLYELLTRLTNEFEEVLFESCSSGGNRFDLGMLYYMPQTWTSDNTDAVERLDIQYGTSIVYPLSTMGAHVSGKPSHQMLRHTPIETRFNVATFGILGIELDLTKLSTFEKKALKEQIAFYKEHRHLLQFGKFYRIESPFESNNTIWMVVNDDSSEALIGYYQKLQQSNPGFECIKLKGLDESMYYSLNTRKQYLNVQHFGPLINDELPINITEGGIIHNIICKNYMYEMDKESISAYGDELMNAGFLPIPQFGGTEFSDKIRYIGDFGSRIYHVKSGDSSGNSMS